MTTNMTDDLREQLAESTDVEFFRSLPVSMVKYCNPELLCEGVDELLKLIHDEVDKLDIDEYEWNTVADYQQNLKWKFKSNMKAYNCLYDKIIKKRGKIDRLERQIDDMQEKIEDLQRELYYLKKSKS